MARSSAKQISPATPSSYVAETTNVANQVREPIGPGVSVAAAAAPNPPAAQSGVCRLGDRRADSCDGGGPSRERPCDDGEHHAAGKFVQFVFAAGGPLAITPTPPATVTNNYALPAAPGYTAPSAPVATNPGESGRQSVRRVCSTDSRRRRSRRNTLQSAISGTSAAVRLRAGAVDAAPVRAGAVCTSTFVRLSGRRERAACDSGGSDFGGSPTACGNATGGRGARSGKLPAGAPPLGFDGYCPVSMRRNWKWTPGDPKYGAIHRGRTYWFAGPQEQQEFLARPDYYGPALSGVDPVLAIDHHQSVPGVRDHSLDYDGQFYLFSSEATLQQFTSNPERYASGVRQAMGLPPSQQTR